MALRWVEQCKLPGIESRNTLRIHGHAGLLKAHAACFGNPQRAQERVMLQTIEFPLLTLRVSSVESVPLRSRRSASQLSDSGLLPCNAESHSKPVSRSRLKWELGNAIVKSRMSWRRIHASSVAGQIRLRTILDPT